MSDLYDSLEDDCDHKNSLPDSPVGEISNAWDCTPEGKITPGNAFYLNPIGAGRESNVRFRNDVWTPQQKKNFLPKIETKGLNETPNLVVDTKILEAQGLQLNNDGSFTKSPRAVAEELPFITREYRNLQFQKKKTYKMVKKTPTIKARKDVFGFTKNPADGISMNKVISARRMKGSSEEILTSGGTGSSRPVNAKQILPRDNMTDSMKEKLLLSQGSTPSGNTKFSYPGVKIQSKFSVDSKLASSCSAHLRKNKKGKTVRLPSDIPANAFKPTLSYAEQRQRENGFNPLRLRLENKKPLSDSERSNFGDSMADRLSEISSRIISSHSLEDEELFYKKLMENDQKQTHEEQSSRSEGSYGITKLKGSAESGSVKDQNMARHNVRLKPISKSLSIDLQPVTDGIVQPLKKNHYCCADSSNKLSRCELAMKAKTYGYLVNARNIFKMKAHCEARLSAKEGGINGKSIEPSSSSEKPAQSSGAVKNASKSTLPKVERRKSTAMDRAAGTKKTPNKTGTSQSPNVGVKGVVLPPVVVPDEKDTKIQTEILNQMSMCLNSANGEIKDELPDI